jgi:hypothetical protein
MDDILQYFKTNNSGDEIDYESGIKDFKNRIYDFCGIETDLQNTETTKINNTEDISKLNTETAIQNTETNINNTEDIAKLNIQNTETKIM